MKVWNLQVPIMMLHLFKAASYAISLFIAKYSKPFIEGDFIRECLIEAIKSFSNS